MKAEHLPRKRKTTVNLDDPRPLKYRCMPGYNDFVYNRIINYCSMSSKDLSLRYIYRKADIQTAAVDHMYLNRPFTEYWVDRGIQVAPFICFNVLSYISVVFCIVLHSCEVLLNSCLLKKLLLLKNVFIIR